MRDMTLSEELQWRGFVNQTTLSDIAELDKQSFTLYWGVDPSADSITVGNLAAGMMVRHFLAHGHKVVLLVGGATGIIGDPDGKDEERDLKPLEEIEHNKQGISSDMQKIFGGMSFEMVDNYEWFKDVHFLDFLRDVGKHMSMTQLLDRDFVKSRIGEGGKGISYAEFSYSLMQGYDFLHLYRTRGVTLQLCGADQWGNSIAGVELIRKLEGAEAHVWSTPLMINRSTGKKFGKSEAGAIWLSPERTTPYDYYQFWLNADDTGVAEYLKIYTLLDKTQIDELEKQTKEQPEARDAQKTLAYEATKLLHGEELARTAQRTTQILFSDDNSELTDDDAEMIAACVPTVASGTHLVDSLVETDIASSKGDARRLLASGAVRVNDKRTMDNISLEARSIVKKGKNQFVFVR